VAEPLVRVASLRKRHLSGAGGVDAVRDVSLSVEAGEFVALVGRSGSGKSTLMSLLGLLDRPDSGLYRLKGRDVGSLDEDRRAAIRGAEIGFVFQTAPMLPRATAQENVALPLGYSGVAPIERRRRALAALDRVGLGDRAQHWPSQLSGGEQQRVGIARALVNNPALILADEPTGSLDSKTSDEILLLLEQLNREGSTIILVTHAAEVANRARRCITLHDGRLIGDTTAGARGLAPARSMRSMS